MGENTGNPSSSSYGRRLEEEDQVAHSFPEFSALRDGWGEKDFSHLVKRSVTVQKMFSRVAG